MSDETWYGELAGENKERAEALGQFESADAFFTAHDESAVKLKGFEDTNWRDGFAGDDDKFKLTLERFSTPLDMGNAYREAQSTIRSGQHQKPPAADAEEADVLAFRKDNNMPLEAKDYLNDLPEGLVLGEDDLPIAEVFMGALHKTYGSVETAHALIEAYNTHTQGIQDQVAVDDLADKTEAEDSMRGTWGSDYRTNMNLVGSFLEATFGKEAKEQLMNGRFADGRAFMNDAKVLEGMAMVQRKIDPVTRLTPPGGDPEQTLNDEIADIEKILFEDRPRYNKDEKMQARLRELYDIRTAHKEKAA